jgi:hypothetical protein
MYAPSCDDEITGLLRYTDEQLSALRAAVVGLTEEQARSRPCRSTLSVAGLVKHAAYCMRGATARLTGAAVDVDLDEAGFEDYQWSFTLRDDETIDGTLADFDATRTAYLAAFAASDPGATILEPPAPWHGIFDERPVHVRFLLVHHVEEFARHAGHADILREQIDGMSVPAVVMSEEGMAANDFFQPYVPEPGTIGAPA